MQGEIWLKSVSSVSRYNDGSRTAGAILFLNLSNPVESTKLKEILLNLSSGSLNSCVEKKKAQRTHIYIRKIFSWRKEGERCRKPALKVYLKGARSEQTENKDDGVKVMASSWSAPCRKLNCGT